MTNNTIPTAPSIQTFALDLGDGITCTARIDLEQVALLPAQKLPQFVRFEWTGQPRNGHWPLYYAWIKTVWQHVADTARKSAVLILRPPSAEPLAVVFEPNQPCEIIPLPRQ